jgi:hypothetical protein
MPSTCGFSQRYSILGKRQGKSPLVFDHECGFKWFLFRILLGFGECGLIDVTDILLKEVQEMRFTFQEYTKWKGHLFSPNLQEWLSIMFTITM